VFRLSAKRHWRDWRYTQYPARLMRYGRRPIPGVNQMASVNPDESRLPLPLGIPATIDPLERLRIGWLSLAAVAAAALVVAVGAGSMMVDAALAPTYASFKCVVAPGDSIATLNRFRASLAADMLFLLAYGLLLHRSLGIHQHAWVRVLQWCVVVTMVADSVENLAALHIVPSIAWRQAEPSVIVFLVMNAAAVLKWTTLGVLMLFLAARWHHAPTERQSLRWAAKTTALLFAMGGVASLTVGATVQLPGSLRDIAASAATLLPALALALQFRLLEVSGVLTRFVVLNRVPLTVLAAMAAFGPLALGPATALLGGILDVPTGWGVTAVTTAALVVAFACTTQINTVRAYAWQRMFDNTLIIFRERALASTVSWTSILVSLSCVFCVGIAATDVNAAVMGAGLSVLDVVLNTLRGVLIALVFAFVVEVLAAICSRPRDQRLPQLAIPFDRLPVIGPWLLRQRQAQPWAFVESAKAIARRVFPVRLFGLQSGYVDDDRRLLPGHSFALVQLAVSLALYVALIFSKWNTVSTPNPWMPTAGSVLLLMLLASWGLAGATFFLDRYRLPLLTALAGLLLVGGSMKWTDHVVQLKNGGSYALATPGQVLRKFPRQPIVVAAAGGGIQAGAWAARVLQGIDNDLAQSGDAFAGRLAMVTGVSGGAMGAVFYGAYRDADPALGTRMSMEPSLDEVASTWIGPDLLRVFGASAAGRGAALERSWTSRLPGEGTAPFTLRRWSERARGFAIGDAVAPFPAFLFESTVVETGQAMAFATTQFPSEGYRNQFERSKRQSPLAESANLVFDLADGRPDQAADVGLTVMTAARLSAAFPYVSPAATLATPTGRPFHLVDGGYYDNYGLVVTAQWLDDALTEIFAKPESPEPLKIDLVIVRSLADAKPELVTIDNGRLRYAADAMPHGWPWQVAAPPLAFINGRTFGQWAGGTQVVRLLVEKWRLRNVSIEVHLFDLPAQRLMPGCRVEPLSWKLTLAQQRCIEQGWQIVRSNAAKLRVGGRATESH
jgi:hypothetical protein